MGIQPAHFSEWPRSSSNTSKKFSNTEDTSPVWSHSRWSCIPHGYHVLSAPLLIQLPAFVLRKQHETVQVLRLLQPMWETGKKLLASAQASPNYCSHFGSEHWIKDTSVCLSLPSSLCNSFKTNLLGKTWKWIIDLLRIKFCHFIPLRLKYPRCLFTVYSI